MSVANASLAQKSRARIPEGGVLWAAVWALATERAHELKLMAQLFDLFDTSRDGHLQFDEFWEFLALVAPEISQADAEDIFLCGAEDVHDGMTQEVYSGLVNRLRLSSDVDTLEQRIAQRRYETEGEAF